MKLSAITNPHTLTSLALMHLVLMTTRNLRQNPTWSLNGRVLVHGCWFVKPSIIKCSSLQKQSTDLTKI